VQYRLAMPVGHEQLETLRHSLCGADPAALVDFDPDTGELRISSCMTPGEAAFALRHAGFDVSTAQIRLQPSECCGGCAG
jgi:hypothetical protein